MKALEAVDEVELRQLLDVIELALEATGRPLRRLAGDNARGDLPRRGETVLFSDHLCSGDRNAVGAYTEGGEYCRAFPRLVVAEVPDREDGCCLSRRPLFHVVSLPSCCCFVLSCEILGGGGGGGKGAPKPMTRPVTLLALADIDLPVSEEVASSMGDVDDDVGVVTGRSFADDECCFPNVNFHFDVFFGKTLLVGKGGGDSKDKSLRGIDERDVLLISRASNWEAVARLSSESPTVDS